MLAGDELISIFSRDVLLFVNYYLKEDEKKRDGLKNSLIILNKDKVTTHLIKILSRFWKEFMEFRRV